MTRKHVQDDDKWEFLLVRDPLYGFVGLTRQEVNVIQTKAFQRLSRIKQLSHTYVVYPSAVHARFEHSLGTLHVADRIARVLHLDDESRTVVRMMALLHDVGHGPFSHLFEIPMRKINGNNFSHEILSQFIIDADVEFSKGIGGLKKLVINALGKKCNSLLLEIISSNLDADKIDYLRRDSYHTGAFYGFFDLERIVRNLANTEDGHHIAITDKGKEAVEGYRLARYSMYTQVYEHHTRLVADDMFLRAFQLAVSDGTIPKSKLKIPTKKKNFDAFLKYYYSLDDASIMLEIARNGKGNSQKMINDIMNRRLLKRGFGVRIFKDEIKDGTVRDKIIKMSAESKLELEKDIARSVKIDPDHIIVHIQKLENKLYTPYEHLAEKNELPILLKKRDGSASFFEDEGEISASSAPLRKFYVFCPEGKREGVKQYIEKRFKITSTLHK